MFLISIAIYLYPISKDSNLIHNPSPVLDEIYLVSSEASDGLYVNKDIDESTLSTLFQNDYWGRPMDSPSSHKSFRPMTVLSFRLCQYVADMLHVNHIWFQRVANILMHAVIVQIVGVLFSLVYKEVGYGAILSQLMFMLHPVHIESVVNIANRAHLQSLLFGLLAMDLNFHAIFSALVYAVALMSCETALFLLPALCLTWICIDVRYLSTDSLSYKDVMRVVRHRLPRIILVTVVAFTYLGIRHVKDWISIPDGLIRPAENPFYLFKGWKRVLSYSYILSVHVVKGMGMGLIDLVGFSHEYGFDCVQKVEDISDTRLMIPVFITLCVLLSLVLAIKNGSRATLHFLTFGAWMATLFPLSGVIKIGTFISDRLVISCTVATSIAWGRFLAVQFKRLKRSRCALLAAILVVIYTHLYFKIQSRSGEWMDSKALLESSLKTCPRSAKSNLEISKVYSGLYPEALDLKKALHHIKIAEEIDPNYCDVDFNFAQLLLKNGNIQEAEDKITKAVLCPFTMIQAQELFRNYWRAILSQSPNAKPRYENQLLIIQKAIEKEEAMEAERQNGDKLSHGSATSEL